MKQEKHLNYSDFGKAIMGNGYQITYKGKYIGGAGTMGKSAVHWRKRAAQYKEYSDMAERDILSLINGSGYPHLYEAIDKINQQLTK